jgi:glucosyl-3-phosphoglycerate synthase
MVADVARVNRIPGDWGLEVGVLAQVFKNCSTQRICQADLCDNYEHKHQPLSQEDPKTGLNKMAIDIARSIFGTLANEGVILSEGFFKTLSITYLRTAQDAIKQYSDDASFNGLFFDRHQEGIAVETFTRSLYLSSQEFLKNPLGSHLIPNWSRVTSAIPDILNLLKEAVEEDNK